MKVILLILIIILLILLLSKREKFKSVNSDFIKHTGQTTYDTKELNDLVAKFMEQVRSIPQTNKEIPGTQGHTISIGWDKAFVPEGVSEEKFKKNLSNLDKKSFLAVLGWEQFYEPSEVEITIIKNHINKVFHNAVKEDDEVIIKQVVKHEDNFFTFLLYLIDPKYDMYYGQVNARMQVQNGTVLIHKLTFEGLVTPFSVMQLKSVDDDAEVQKPYSERERREQKFLSKDEIDDVVKDFEKRKNEIMLRMNAHAAGAVATTSATEQTSSVASSATIEQKIENKLLL